MKLSGNISISLHAGATHVGDEAVILRIGSGMYLGIDSGGAPILFPSDKATTMFDTESEFSFLEGCSKILARRNGILITDRRVSLALADREVGITEGGFKGEWRAPSPGDTAHLVGTNSP